jgi:hypothetical protein
MELPIRIRIRVPAGTVTVFSFWAEALIVVMAVAIPTRRVAARIISFCMGLSSFPNL